MKRLLVYIFLLILSASSVEARTLATGRTLASGRTLRSVGFVDIFGGQNVTQLIWDQAVGSNGGIVMLGMCGNSATDTIGTPSSDLDGNFTLLSALNSTDVRSKWFYLVNPTVGTHRITTAASEAQNMAGGSFFQASIDATIPFLSGVVSNSGVGTNPTATLSSSETGRLATDHVCMSQLDSLALTVGSQTQKWNNGASQEFPANRKSAGSTVTGDGALTPTWTAASATWIHQAVELNNLTPFTLTTADFNWTWSQGSGGAITDFNLKCRTTPSGAYTSTYTITNEALRTIPADTPLDAGTFWCAIFGVNANGESGPSNEIRFKVQ